MTDLVECERCKNILRTRFVGVFSDMLEVGSRGGLKDLENWDICMGCWNDLKKWKEYTETKNKKAKVSGTDKTEEKKE